MQRTSQVPWALSTRALSVGGMDGDTAGPMPPSSAAGPIGRRHLLELVIGKPGQVRLVFGG